MRSAIWRGRFVMFCLACSTILSMGGCGLSDRQLATIWQSVLTAALTTIVQGLVGNMVGGGG